MIDARDLAEESIRQLYLGSAAWIDEIQNLINGEKRTPACLGLCW